MRLVAAMNAEAGNDAVPRRAARVRGPARSAAAPVQDARDRDRQHPDRVHHRRSTSSTSRSCRRCRSTSPPTTWSWRRRSPTSSRASWCRRPSRSRSAAEEERGGARPARGAHPPPARVPEVQGRRREAGRAAHRGAQRLRARREVDARRRRPGAAGRAVGVEADRGVRAHPGEGRQAKLTHDVVVDRVSIGDRINQLVDRLEAGGGSFRFDSCFDLSLPEPELRNQLVVTLLAILELARLKVVRVLQCRRRGDAVRDAGRGHGPRGRAPRPRHVGREDERRARGRRETACAEPEAADEGAAEATRAETSTSAAAMTTRRSMARRPRAGNRRVPERDPR